MRFLGDMDPKASGIEARVINDERIFARGPRVLEIDVQYISAFMAKAFLYQSFSLVRAGIRCRLEHYYQTNPASLAS